MTGFLLAFFSIYSLMHAFVYSWAKILLPESPPVRAAAVVFMALMIFAPVGTRLLERAGRPRAARACGIAGYGWLGFIFYCFWGFLLAGIAGGLCGLANLVAGLSLPVLNGPATAIGVLAAAAGVNIYGYFEARTVRVERLVIKSGKLPPEIERVRIAQISDVHLGLMAAEKRMARILRGIEAERPDILVSTGDLVDGNIRESERVAALFSRIPAGLGKYAVMGNHEVYAGLAESIEAERALGFSVLRGEAKRIENILNIVGVDDPAVGPAGGLEEEETAILGRVQNGLFTLLLKHRPDPANGSAGLFDLQLSGHTHYGQLFPFRYIVRLFYPLQNGPYNLSNGSVLYTSRGSGSWGPAVRVLARPEVTIVDVVREEGAHAKPISPQIRRSG